MTKGGSVKYQQIVRTISETPWAILPSKLAAIQDFVALRAAGDTLTEADVKAAIGGRASSRQPETVGTVAILPLYGVLVPRADLMSEISGATSLERWGNSFSALLNNPDVGAILIDIDSPGGSTDFVTETAALIRSARGDKPIVAIANADAGSAAYWLGAQADEFYSTPSGKVGSVGVFAGHTDISVMQEKAGIKTELISSTPEKVELSPYEPLSDDARAAMQHRVDAMMDMFVADVAAGRGVSEQEVRDGFGRGRMLPAAEAVEAGMIDGVATLEETVARMLQEVAVDSGLGGRSRGTSSAANLQFNISGDSSGVDSKTWTAALQRELLRAGLHEPERELPPGYKKVLAAKRGLSFADEAAAARDAVASVVDRTRSLAEWRRGRVTAAKREQLLSIHDQLAEAALSIDELLAHVDRDKTAEALTTELTRFESVRVTL